VRTQCTCKKKWGTSHLSPHLARLSVSVHVKWTRAQKVRAIIDRVESLTREPGFIYTLALILLRDLFMTPEDIADINPHEHLHFQEITFLTGLLVKNRIDFTLPLEADSARQFADVYRLFLELHGKYHEPLIEELGNLAQHGLGTETREENYKRVFGAGAIVTESIFYSDSGAYDFQLWEFAVEKYQSDEDWINKHIGVSVREMGNIARELKRLHELRFNSLIGSAPEGFSEICKASLAVFCFDRTDLEHFGGATGPFLKAFSLTPGAANLNLQLPGQYNELQSKTGYPVRR
jgi:hypothetical protein